MTQAASVVTDTFTDLGDNTEMVLHQDGDNTDDAHAEGAQAGWIECFDRLAEHPASAREER